MSQEEKPKRNYIRYTAAELAAVPSPAQMERELQDVFQTFALGALAVGNLAFEYQRLQALGPAGYAAQKRLEANMRARSPFNPFR